MTLIKVCYSASNLTDGLLAYFCSLFVLGLRLRDFSRRAV